MGKQLRDRLVGYLQDAHAMEQNVALMLESIVLMVQDDDLRELFEQHQQTTARHEQLLRDRITELGGSLSLVKEATSLGGALVKGFIDGARSDKHGKIARDAFITEHMEIAAYELLERVAREAGDEKTAQLAAQIRADEYAMADAVAGNWDRFVELSLQEQGLVAGSTPGS